MSREADNSFHIDYLNIISNINSQLIFFNSFRGVPITSDGYIHQIKADSILFSVPKAQLLCIKNDCFTFLNLPSLNFLVRAEVIYLDWDNNIVELGRFESVKGSIGKRIFTRVETESPIRARLFIRNSRKHCRVEITEISTGGLSFYIHKAFYKRKEVRLGKSIVVDYILPFNDTLNSQTTILHKGVIKNIIPGWGKQYYRIGMQNTSIPKNETIITDYINARQKNIMQELKNYV